MQTNSYILGRSSKLTKLSNSTAKLATMDSNSNSSKSPRGSIIDTTAQTQPVTETTSSVKDRITAKRQKRSPAIITQASAVIEFEVLHRQAIPKGSLVTDSTDIIGDNHSTVKTRPQPLSHSLLAASFLPLSYSGGSASRDNSVGHVPRSLDPSGYVSSDDESVLTELGVSTMSDVSVSRVGSKDHSVNSTPKESLTRHSAGVAVERYDLLSRKHSYDFMSADYQQSSAVPSVDILSESFDDVFDAQQSLDFTQDDALYPEVTRFESNRITEHCDSIQQKIQQTYQLLLLRREWVASSDPDALLKGQPSAQTPVTSPSQSVSTRKTRMASDPDKSMCGSEGSSMDHTPLMIE
eukprot:gene33807-41705_t